MKFRIWVEAKTFEGYGGPAFKPDQFTSQYQNNDFLRYRQLYEDVQLELDNMKVKLKSVWKTTPQQLIWFEDSLDPVRYTSGMTVDTVWTEDSTHYDYFGSMVEWLTELEGTGFEAEDLAQYDRSTMNCLYKLLMSYDFDKLGDDAWDRWGPYDWQPEGGEWERCRRIAHDQEEHPVTVLGSGNMIDGAHRLAVAIFNRRRSYPCLVGFPEHWFQK